MKTNATKLMVLGSTFLLTFTGLMSSCSNELKNFPSNSATQGVSILHAPDFYAWSGNEIIGATSRYSDNSKYRTGVKPDFSSWYSSWWNPLNITLPNVPEDGIQGSSSTTFDENKAYVFSDNTGEELYQTDLKAGDKIFIIQGSWKFDEFSTPENIESNDYPEIYVFEEASLSIDCWHDNTNSIAPIQNVKIFNFGYTSINWDEETVKQSLLIYNAGELLFEQDNIDVTLNLDPEIYSIGKVIFNGSVILMAENYYFNEVCVTGKMTVSENTNVECAYLRTPEIVCKNGSIYNVAPDGLILTGTIYMEGNSIIQTENGKKTLANILTNNILGQDMGYTHQEITVESFKEHFKNIDIWVVNSINKSINDNIKNYQPGISGVTSHWDTSEFDGDANNGEGEVVTKDGIIVGNIECGGGYNLLPKKDTQTPTEPENPEDPDNPSEPSAPKDPDNPVNDKEKRHLNEVELNLTIEDSHAKYNNTDLWTKLSIHVRKGTDVKVIIPIPNKYVCESDDFAIFETHDTNAGITTNKQNPYISDTDHSIHYFINNTWDVVLNVHFAVANEIPGYPEGCIIVTTDGITSELIEYLFNKNGDGINFEIWNYFQTNNISSESQIKSDLNREELWNIINEVADKDYGQSIIDFIDEDPDFYINAYGYEWINNNDNSSHTENINPWDCRVKPIDKISFIMNINYCYHLNGTPWNIIWIHKNVDKNSRDYKAHTLLSTPSVEVLSPQAK